MFLGEKTMSNRIVTKSRYFSRVQDSKTVDVLTEDSTLAGVRVTDLGNKKGDEVEIFLPRGDKMVRVVLSGRQGRSVFNTLARHYDRK